MTILTIVRDTFNSIEVYEFIYIETQNKVRMSDTNDKSI